MKNKILYITLICILLFPFSSALGFQATFAPRLSITEEYTDNIFLANEDEEDDFITTLSVGFTVQLLGKYSGLNLSYDPSYSFYDEFTENDTLRHRAQLSSWTNISRNTRLELNDSFIYTEDPVSEADIPTLPAEDPTAPIDSSTRRSREPYFTNTVSLGLTHQFGESDSINLVYEYSILVNEDENIEDNSMSRPSIGLNYWFTPQFGLDTGLSYTRGEFEIEEPLQPSDDFDNWNGSVRLINKFTKHFEGFVQYEHTDMDFDGETENYQVYDSSIGINYSTDENTTLSLSVGYFLQDREVSEDESGISVNGNLGKSWTFRRGYINFTGSSGYNESYFGAENLGFNIFYQAQCIALHNFSRHITGDISGSYRINNYVNIDPEREDNTSRAGLGLTIQPLTWLSIRLNYSYRKLDSSEDANDYEENRGLIRITLSSSVPSRTSE